MGVGISGTGLELASVQRIVRRQGRKVWIEGEEDRETCHHFKLPGREASPNASDL